MKRILIISIAVISISLLALKIPEASLPIGSPLPNAELKMKNIDGKEVSFNDAMNKNGLLVMFSCNTCPVVKGYQPRTNEICKYAISKKIGVILLNSNEGFRNSGDSYDDMKEYGQQNNYTWNYVVDKNSVMANIFGANRTPECFLFNSKGILVYHGAIDNNANSPDEVTRKHLAIAIDEMTEGKEVSLTETRSVGCSIRRKS